MADERNQADLGVNFPESTLSSEINETLLPVKRLLFIDDDPLRKYRGKSKAEKAKLFLFTVFPFLTWLTTYKSSYLIGDIVGGLTITSLAVPQSLAYAPLANLPPQFGLYTDILPPLVYAIFGSSRHIVVGPTAVVSLLTGSILSRYFDPENETSNYLLLSYATVFYAGLFQISIGLLRLGFVVDFLSHAVVIGFTGGAAVTIALQQLMWLLGYTKFTTSTDIVSVLSFVFQSTYLFQWKAFVIGISFLVFLLVLRTLNYVFRNNKRLSTFFFFLNALGPLITVIISTASVYASGANKSGVPTVKQIPSGFSSLSTVGKLQLGGTIGANAAAAGIVIALIAISEAVAIARTFAAKNGYHIDGNYEFVAFGAANIIGSFTSAYTATGSFSRTSVNYVAGANTILSNVVLSLCTMVVVAAITPVFQYLPQSALAAIIIVAVMGLVDVPGTVSTWNADKVDFLALIGTFFGVLFVSIEVGLLIGIAISIFKVLVQVTRPSLTQLGAVQGTHVWRSLRQYANAQAEEGMLVLRVDAPLFFPNAPYLRETMLTMAEHYEEDKGCPLTHFVLDFTPVSDIDTTGIVALNQARQQLEKQGVQLAISNPSNLVLRKMGAAGFVNALGSEWFFVSAHESVKSIKSFRQLEGLGDDEETGPKAVEIGKAGSQGDGALLTKNGIF